MVDGIHLFRDGPFVAAASGREMSPLPLAEKGGAKREPENETPEGSVTEECQAHPASGKDGTGQHRHRRQSCNSFR